MKNSQLKTVVLGLSITSSWGNGHATTYRALLGEFSKRGHEVLFLERDVPWYAGNRDLPDPEFCRTELYNSLADLKERFTKEVRDADLVLVGSYVPEGVEVGQWVINTARNIKAFYDIDTPVTLAKLAKGDYEYLSPELIRKYDLYLSFTGGPTLELLENKYGSPMARPLYCSVDPGLYYPQDLEKKWDLGYLGTYSDDRQPTLENLLLEPARRSSDKTFAVFGPMYPERIEWPANVERKEHLAPREHNAFYNSQRFTLNVTRQDMIKAGYAPSVRLFEAASCGVPIISDYWDGLDSFFKIGQEILVAENADDTLRYLKETTENERQVIADRARKVVLNRHTAAHRAADLESYALSITGKQDNLVKRG